MIPPPTALSTLRRDAPPRVSVIVPMHNASATLQRTIDSVRAQELREWELICIDDASSDDTRQIARSAALADRRVSLLCLDRNQGPAAARNAGIDAARADYLHFLDADDTITPEALQALTQAERACSSGAAAGEFAIVSNADELCRHRRTRRSLGLREILSDADLITHAHVVRRDRVGSLRFSTGTHGFEDTDFWLRLAESGVRWTCVHELVAHYHVRPSSLSKNAPAMLADGLRVLDDLRQRCAGSSDPLVHTHHIELSRRRKAITWATRAAVLSAPDAADDCAALALSAGGCLLPAHRTGESAVYQIAQGLGVWPVVENVDLWAPRLLAFWRALARRGALRSLPSAIRAFARASVRQRDVAASLIAGLNRQPMTILGFGRNGRELAEQAARAGVSCVARDHHPIASPLVAIEPIDAPLDPGRLVVVTPDADAGLLPLAGGRCIRWSRERAHMSREMAELLARAA